MEAGVNISNYCYVSTHENDSCFIATESGITKITAMYPVMIMTLASLQWKRG